MRTASGATRWKFFLRTSPNRSIVFKDMSAIAC
jgi:hypothetical protein